MTVCVHLVYSFIFCRHTLFLMVMYSNGGSYFLFYRVCVCVFSMLEWPPEFMRSHEITKSSPHPSFLVCCVCVEKMLIVCSFLSWLSSTLTHACHFPMKPQQTRRRVQTTLPSCGCFVTLQVTTSRSSSPIHSRTLSNQTKVTLHYTYTDAHTDIDTSPSYNPSFMQWCI